MTEFRNTNREEAVTVRSADGDSAVIPAGATVPLDDKFKWRLPRAVRVKQEPITAQAQPAENASPGAGETVSGA